MMKTNYTIKTIKKNGKPIEYAIVNGVERKILTTDDGFKYFKIQNPYVDKNDIFAREFVNCITDAIRAIREGYAHALFGSTNPQIESTVSPIYILDEKKGEECRNKTIEGFKDAEFGYAIKFGRKDSFTGYDFLDTNGNRIGPFNFTVPAFYKTREVAQAVMDSYEEKAIELAAKLANKEIAYNEISYNTNFVIRTLSRQALKDIDGVIVVNRYDIYNIYGYDIVQHINAKLP